MDEDLEEIELKEELEELAEICSRKHGLEDDVIKDATELFDMKQDYKETEISEEELLVMEIKNQYPKIMTFMLTQMIPGHLFETFPYEVKTLSLQKKKPKVEPPTEPSPDKAESDVKQSKADVSPSVLAGSQLHTPWHSLLRLTTIVSDLLSIEDRCGRGCACASCRGALHVLV